MPDLLHSLHDRDLAFLRTAAQRWGVELTANGTRPAQTQLAGLILEPGTFDEGLEVLQADVRAALTGLQREGGRLPWVEFIRLAGEVRQMGLAKRDRERPDLNPISPAEVLWYRCLVFRAFFNSTDGPLEFAYIPEDVLERLPPAPSDGAGAPGKPASPANYAHIILVSDAILDQACSLLAALRMQIPVQQVEPSGGLDIDFLKSVLSSGSLIGRDGLPTPDAARGFLEKPRAEALSQLFQVWRTSVEINELRTLPGLKFEGEWKNDPLKARQCILEQLMLIPAGVWWDADAFIQHFHTNMPDFQRPAGDYDSWFIRDETSGDYLRGFDCWPRIDGALIHAILLRLLPNMGVVDLGAPDAATLPATFRINPWGSALLRGDVPGVFREESGAINISADGLLRVPISIPRSARYQIARFCAWEGFADGVFTYRITPPSLERARRQSLRAGQLIALMRRLSSAPPQPTLVQALERWEENGTQARIDEMIVLRVASPEILAALRKSRAGRFLGEPLGPTAVTLPAGARDKVLKALAELGYIADTGNSDLAGYNPKTG
jgi:hypothetical protein